MRVHPDELPREMSVVAKEDAELDALADSIVQVVKEARASTVRHINNTMCKFYLAYPICQNVSDKLNWSQICELITIADPLERSFYEKECVKEHWDVLALRRQMDSGLFLRLAASKDKAGILALAEQGVVIRQPEDIVKDTYTLEFLGLPDVGRFSESDLEQRIIDNLQSFLLELGKGFAFIGLETKILQTKKRTRDEKHDEKSIGSDNTQGAGACNCAYAGWHSPSGHLDRPRHRHRVDLCRQRQHGNPWKWRL